MSFKGVCSVQHHSQQDVQLHRSAGVATQLLRSAFFFFFSPTEKLNAASSLSRKRCTVKKWVKSQQQDGGLSSQQQSQIRASIVKHAVSLKGHFKWAVLKQFFI